MTPDLTPPNRVSRFGWSDVTVVALLLITTGALLLPAIHNSRFTARVAACQDELRQFGAALAAYGHQHGNTVPQMANNGRLTPTGMVAVGRLGDGFLSDRRQPICPDIWLAAQGALPASQLATQIENLRRTSPAAARILVSQSPGPQSWAANYWPGTWRDGTATDLRLPPSPADVPILADAPSADLPGQTLESHGGRGRNVLFEDGHVDFVSPPTRRDIVELILSQGSAPPVTETSAPIVFVRGQ
jgi:prepilin-type processing-associated H-X9-DG protein